MPTYQALPRFVKDFDQLSESDKQRFREAVAKFVEDLERGKGFRPGLRVRGIQGAPGIFEMTWAPDGRATFEYGPEVKQGKPRVIWRRVGGHDVFGEP